jgi:hypothetical protein
MLNAAELQEAQRVQATLQGRLAAVAADRGLMPRARDRQRARALLEAQAGMRVLRDKSDERVQAEYNKAYRAAFGLDQSRSAEDRAIRAELSSLAAAGDLGAIEAYQRMQSALVIGDSLTARALAAIAFEHRGDELGADSWTVVAELYGGSAPAADRAMAAVYDAGAEPDKVTRFRDKLQTEVNVPDDLRRGDLNAIAADDDGPAGAVSGARFGA